MEKTIKLQILESAGKIFEQSKACKLDESCFTNIDKELAILSDYFKTTKIQSFFVAIVFALNYKGDSVDLNDLIEYFDCNPMKLLQYHDEFNELYSRRIFVKERSSHRMPLAGVNEQFIINKKISEAILQNCPIPNSMIEEATNIFELLEMFNGLFQKLEDNEIIGMELYSNIKDLISINVNFPLIKKVKEYDFSIEDTCLYLLLIWKTITGFESICAGRALDHVFDKPVSKAKYMQKLISGDIDLIKTGLIEIVEANFFSETEIKLTEKALKELNECDIKLFANKKKKDNIILPSEIPYKDLIYNDNEIKQVSMLRNLLGEQALSETRQRLKEKNLPQGVTVLLHGLPGTGKTETAKQIARETNREILKVEISHMKSMWYGESEKIIKRVFAEYNKFLKESEHIPILLFNEADAIISKRRDIGKSNITQTENAIQNIILEELENFEGILIATTNLVGNLDAAFERRFLFKIEFKKPGQFTKAKIWKLKIPFLSDEEYVILSEKFDFSGGQIDNISRKIEIFDIVNGQKVDFNNIIGFCEEELLSGPIINIGFKKHN